MTSCAGITTFKGKREGCDISLSVPLLAFRPRKDLVETLLVSCFTLTLSPFVLTTTGICIIFN